MYSRSGGYFHSVLSRDKGLRLPQLTSMTNLLSASLRRLNECVCAAAAPSYVRHEGLQLCNFREVSIEEVRQVRLSRVPLSTRYQRSSNRSNVMVDVTLTVRDTSSSRLRLWHLTAYWTVDSLYLRDVCAAVKTVTAHAVPCTSTVCFGPQTSRMSAPIMCYDLPHHLKYIRGQFKPV